MKWLVGYWLKTVGTIVIRSTCIEEKRLKNDTFYVFSSLMDFTSHGNVNLGVIKFHRSQNFTFHYCVYEKSVKSAEITVC